MKEANQVSYLRKPKLNKKYIKYKPEYCHQLIDYFNIEPYKIENELHTNKDGSTFVVRKEIPNDMRFKSEFARQIGVNIDTLKDWCKIYPEWKEAYEAVKGLQEKVLVTNGLRGLYKASFAIFTAKNILHWRDSVDVNNQNQITIGFYEKIMNRFSKEVVNDED